MRDTVRFIDRAQDIYGYPNFVCDSSGSICEVVDAANPADPTMQALSQNLLLVWIKGTPDHRADLIQRFDRAPKPMYYRPEFLAQVWQEFLAANHVTEAQVNPDAFLRYGYARLLEHRQPRYEAMATWGVTVTADEVTQVRSAADVDALIAAALERRATKT